MQKKNRLSGSYNGIILIVLILLFLHQVSSSKSPTTWIENFQKQKDKELLILFSQLLEHLNPLKNVFDMVCSGNSEAWTNVLEELDTVNYLSRSIKERIIKENSNKSQRIERSSDAICNRTTELTTLECRSLIPKINVRYIDLFKSNGMHLNVEAGLDGCGDTIEAVISTDLVCQCESFSPIISSPAITPGGIITSETIHSDNITQLSTTTNVTGINKSPEIIHLRNTSKPPKTIHVTNITQSLEPTSVTDIRPSSNEHISVTELTPQSPHLSEILSLLSSESILAIHSSTESMFVSDIAPLTTPEVTFPTTASSANNTIPSSIPKENNVAKSPTENFFGTDDVSLLSTESITGIHLSSKPASVSDNIQFLLYNGSIVNQTSSEITSVSDKLLLSFLNETPFIIIEVPATSSSGITLKQSPNETLSVSDNVSTLSPEGTTISHSPTEILSVGDQLPSSPNDTTVIQSHTVQTLLTDATAATQSTSGFKSMSDKVPSSLESTIPFVSDTIMQLPNKKPNISDTLPSSSVTETLSVLDKAPLLPPDGRKFINDKFISSSYEGITVTELSTITPTRHITEASSSLEGTVVRQSATESLSMNDKMKLLSSEATTVMKSHTESTAISVKVPPSLEDSTFTKSPPKIPPISNTVPLLSSEQSTTSQLSKSPFLAEILPSITPEGTITIQSLTKSPSLHNNATSLSPPEIPSESDKVPSLQSEFTTSLKSSTNTPFITDEVPTVLLDGTTFMLSNTEHSSVRDNLPSSSPKYTTIVHSLGKTPSINKNVPSLSHEGITATELPTITPFRSVKVPSSSLKGSVVTQSNTSTPFVKDRSTFLLPEVTTAIQSTKESPSLRDKLSSSSTESYSVTNSHNETQPVNDKVTSLLSESNTATQVPTETLYVSDKMPSFSPEYTSIKEPSYVTTSVSDLDKAPLLPPDGRKFLNDKFISSSYEGITVTELTSSPEDTFSLLLSTENPPVSDKLVTVSFKDSLVIHSTSETSSISPGSTTAIQSASETPFVSYIVTSLSSEVTPTSFAPKINYTCDDTCANITEEMRNLSASIQDITLELIGCSNDKLALEKAKKLTSKLNTQLQRMIEVPEIIESSQRQPRARLLPSLLKNLNEPPLRSVYAQEKEVICPVDHSNLTLSIAAVENALGHLAENPRNTSRTDQLYCSATHLMEVMKESQILFGNTFVPSNLTKMINSKINQVLREAAKVENENENKRISLEKELLGLKNDLKILKIDLLN